MALLSTARPYPQVLSKPMYPFLMAQIAGFAWRTGQFIPCNTTPKQAPAQWTAITCSSVSRRQWKHAPNKVPRLKPGFNQRYGCVATMLTGAAQLTVYRCPSHFAACEKIARRNQRMQKPANSQSASRTNCTPARYDQRHLHRNCSSRRSHPCVQGLKPYVASRNLPRLVRSRTAFTLVTAVFPLQPWDMPFPQ